MTTLQNESYHDWYAARRAERAARETAVELFLTQASPPPAPPAAGRPQKIQDAAVLNFVPAKTEVAQ